MADRSVVVSLKVKRDDGKAFADVQKQAEATAKAVERIPKAMREAASFQQRISAEADQVLERRKFNKGVEAELSRRGEGGPGLLRLLGFGGLGERFGRAGVGVAAAYAAAEGAERSARVANLYRDDRLTPGLRRQGALEQIPLLGPLGVKLGRGVREAFTGEEFHNQRFLEQSGLRIAGAEAAYGYQAPARELARSASGASDVRERSKALADLEVVTRKVNDAARAGVSVQNVAKYNEALNEQKLIQDRLYETTVRLGQARAAQAEGARAFVSQEFYQQQYQVNLLRKVKERGIEGLRRDEYQEALPVLQQFAPNLLREQQDRLVKASPFVNEIAGIDKAAETRRAAAPQEQGDEFGKALSRSIQEVIDAAQGRVTNDLERRKVELLQQAITRNQ